MPDFVLEKRCAGIVCGVDEAGRGPLAGPVVAAAVILDRRRLPRLLRDELDDSKKLNAEEREEYAAILRRSAVAIGVGAASVGEIDRINILRATLDRHVPRGGGARHRAGDRAGRRQRAAAASCAVETVIGGDGLSLSIAAASVIAKVTRDRLMRRLAARYGGYGWDRNAGYATAEHRAAILALGPTPHHRRSFAPVQLRARIRLQRSALTL